MREILPRRAALLAACSAILVLPLLALAPARDASAERVAAVALAPRVEPTSPLARVERAGVDPGLLQGRLETGGGRLLPGEGDRRAAVREAVDRFYAARGHRPAWVAPGGRALAAHGAGAVDALAAAADHGLDPAAYGAADLVATARRLAAGERLAGDDLLDLELRLSGGLALFASDLARGRFDPGDLGRRWETAPRTVDLTAALAAAAADGVEPVLALLAPPHPGYRALLELRRRYAAIAAAGGWPSLPGGPTLEPGDAADGTRLRALAARLAAEDDLDAADAAALEATGSTAPEARYDEALVPAVRRFQARHGLEPDGKVGPATSAALAATADERLRQIDVNLERWRWIPGELGRRHLRVNVPGFTLHGFEDGVETLTTKVVVGRKSWPTPVFTDELTWVEVNPWWGVPASIAGGEMLAHGRRDPGYFARNGFEVVHEGRVVDPRSVDWSRDDGERLPLSFRQKPGPANALGRIKFMFPNRFNVYLHDTPEKRLFATADRAASHGCIRVEQPLDLAAFVFRGDPDWDEAAVRAAIEAGRNRRIDLREPIPVYILYWTSFTAGDGAAAFRADVYGYDRSHAEALARRGHRLGVTGLTAATV